MIGLYAVNGYNYNYPPLAPAGSNGYTQPVRKTGVETLRVEPLTPVEKVRFRGVGYDRRGQKSELYEGIQGNYFDRRV